MNHSGISPITEGYLAHASVVCLELVSNISTSRVVWYDIYQPMKVVGGVYVWYVQNCTFSVIIHVAFGIII